MNKFVGGVLQRLRSVRVPFDISSLFRMLNCAIVGNIMGAVMGLDDRSAVLAVLSLTGVSAACLGLALNLRSIVKFGAASACVWIGFALTFRDFAHVHSPDLWLVTAVWWSVTLVLGGTIVEFRNRRRGIRARRRAFQQDILARAVATAVRFAPAGIPHRSQSH